MKPDGEAPFSRTALSFRWHERQRRSWASFKAAVSGAEPAVTAVRWQSRQVGARGVPASTPLPCSDARKRVFTSAWQVPQAAAWRAGANRKAASLTATTSWLPWQAAQGASALPWPAAARAIPG